MYKLIALISLIVRNFYLPNPFAGLKYGVAINWIIEPLLQFITFAVVGLFYQRGSFPAWGSILYLFFYVTHVSLILLCSKFDFTNTATIVITICYIGVIIGLTMLKNRLSTKHYL